MKRLSALFAAVVLFAPISYAGILDDVKYHGEGSFYGYSTEKKGSYEAATVFYGTLGLSANIYENISADFGIGYTNLWGDYNGAYAFDGKPITLDGYGEGILGKVRIIEANVTLDKLFGVDGLKLKIGRQFYGDEDSAVIYFGVRRDLPTLASWFAYDNSKYFSPITSIDAVTAYYENAHIKVNALFSTFDNGSITTDAYGNPAAKNKNATLKGFDFKYVNIANMIDLQAYFYDLENYNAYGSYLPRHYGIVGAKGAFHKEMGNGDVIKASVEIAENYAGAEILSDDIKALNTGMLKLDASYKISKIGLTPRASLGSYGGYDKKDGTKYFASFGNYYPGLIGEPNGRSAGLLFADTVIVNFGLDYTIKKFTFGFDYFSFSHDNDYWKTTGEIDLQAKYAYTESVIFNFGIAHFFADKSDGDIAYIQGGISYKF
ncbi:MAG: hypothetical protein LBU09_04530 [Endomicrobium sp.]|nr:hypothetical protein [Endomicrobium sp.]